MRTTGAGFDFPYTAFVEIDGRHLFVADYASETAVMIVDWLNPQRAVERLTLADGSRALSAGSIRSHPNYFGNFTFEDIFEGAPAGVPDAYRAFIATALQRAAEIERTAQPDLVQIIGTGGDDDLIGTARAEIIRGAGGNDEVEGRAGTDQVFGDGGVDIMNGGGGGDLMLGGAGNDRVSGGAGADELYGQAGVDLLFGGGFNDVLFGGPGADSLDGGPGGDTLNGGPGNDTLLGREGVDHLSGGAGRDELDGGTGNDVLAGGLDPDQLFGGDGNDLLQGGGDSDLLVGGDGDDTLQGGAGDDELQGLDGSDLMTGGAGQDRFIVGPPSDLGTGDEDSITDFSANDTLVLSDIVSLGGPTGDELDEFLQFAFNGSDTTLAIDQDGASDFALPEASVVFQGVDVTSGVVLQAEIIDALLASGQLEIAAAA